MIGMLRGKIASRTEGLFIVDVGGVGYEVLTTKSTEEAVGAAPGEVTLHVHTSVKEDSITLFGFASLEERDTFRLLLGVSNVGPRTALSLLGGLTVQELADAVARKDLARLSSVQGIGKKTAERLVFELQDKLKLFAIAGNAPSATPRLPPPSSARSDLFSALANLGYKPAQQDRAVAAVASMLEAKAPFEELLREALRALARP